MSTEYSDVYDLFLQRVQDWKLDELYLSDPTGFEAYIQGFLVSAIPYYAEISEQSLARNDTTALFTEDLTDRNKEILSIGMAVQWLERQIQDIRQMNLHIADRDFKTYSEAQNLRAKEERLITLRERYSQRITETAWYDMAMEDWVNGTFYTASGA